MSDVIIARSLHVIAILLWIGGVAFVTTVLLPAVRDLKSPQERVEFFEQVERRFAWQARITTLLAGGSGFYLVHAWNLWDRFRDAHFWWMHAMVVVWLIFTLMLFVAEPLFLHRWFLERARREPDSTFLRILRMHRVLLALSLVTAAGAVAGAHGWLF